jgi:hypothetical protein
VLNPYDLGVSTINVPHTPDSIATRGAASVHTADERRREKKLSFFTGLTIKKLSRSFMYHRMKKGYIPEERLNVYIFF